MRFIGILAIFTLASCYAPLLEEDWLLPIPVENPVEPPQTAPVTSPPQTVIIVNPDDGDKRRERSNFWINGPSGPFDDFQGVTSLNNVLPPECLRISPIDPDRYVFAESCLLERGKAKSALPAQCRAIAQLKGGELIPAFRARCMMQRGYRLDA